MADKEPELKTYKVLKRLGWQGGLYVEGDTIEMTEEWAKYYIDNEVLKPATKAEIQQANKDEG